MLEHAADEVVGELGEPEAARVGGVVEQVRLARRIPQRDVEVAAVAGQVAERLRHERGELAALLRHDVDHVAEEDRAVAGDEHVVVLEVRLELAVRVLVVVRVVAPAEPVHVARERREELVVAVQRLRVVAGLVGGIERVVDDQPAVARPCARGRTRPRGPIFMPVAELGRALDGVAQDRARAVRPRLALDRDVAGEAREPVLPRHLRVRADVSGSRACRATRASAPSARPRSPRSRRPPSSMSSIACTGISFALGLPFMSTNCARKNSIPSSFARCLTSSCVISPPWFAPA